MLPTFLGGVPVIARRGVENSAVLSAELERGAPQVRRPRSATPATPQLPEEGRGLMHPHLGAVGGIGGCALCC